jgi:hypothetical protein
VPLRLDFRGEQTGAFRMTPSVFGSLLVGDPAVFAIESGLAMATTSNALGFFLLHVDGNRYGVKTPTATMLGCSYDAVVRRIERRHQHRAAFAIEFSAARIVEAVSGALYSEERQSETFFGMTAEAFADELKATEVVWAPDGDAAFDDGGHVLQFDVADRVRLIAFVNPDESHALPTVADVWLDAGSFYGLLEQWRAAFEAKCAAARGASEALS